MKKFSQVFEAAKPKLDIQDDTINYISVAELKKYLEICDKFISDEAKAVVKYLIDNNANYISELSNDTDENALAAFYNAGVPKTNDETLKELYKNIGVLYKKGRLMEIPVFQTKDQFEGIITKTESPDQVILDLKTEAGRNEVAKRYTPLVHKMAKQFMGKTNLDYEDLVSAGFAGLTYAMNWYGKKTDKNNADLETIVAKTFTQFAAFTIRGTILRDVTEISRTVRVPLSQLNAEKKDTGYITKNNTVSGDKPVSANGDESSKSLFDYVGSTDNATRGIDNEDAEKLWKAFFAQLEKHFDKTMIDIYYHSLGLNGYEKIKKKELADKFGVAQSSITYYLYKVNNYIQTDKKMKAMITDIYELMAECKQDEDMDYDPEEGLHIQINNTSEE